MPCSECSAAIEEDEHNGRTSKSDEGEGSEVGDQVEIEAHGECVRSNDRCSTRLRGIRPKPDTLSF